GRRACAPLLHRSFAERLKIPTTHAKHCPLLRQIPGRALTSLRTSTRPARACKLDWRRSQARSAFFAVQPHSRVMVHVKLPPLWPMYIRPVTVSRPDQDLKSMQPSSNGSSKKRQERLMPTLGVVAALLCLMASTPNGKAQTFPAPAKFQAIEDARQNRVL